MEHILTGRIIKQINDAIERRAKNSLRENDLTLAQMQVLLSLNQKFDKTYSLKELESILDVAQSTCAGIVNRLIKKEFVESFADPTDKRVKLVKITPAGEKCCLEADANVKEIESLLLNGLTNEERKSFNEILQRIYDNVK